MTSFEYYNSLSFAELKELARVNDVSIAGGKLKIIQGLIDKNEYIFHQQQLAHLQQIQQQAQIIEQQQAQTIEIQQSQTYSIKPQCPYANSCYRKNPVHFENYDHPQELLQRIQLEQQQLQLQHVEQPIQTSNLYKPQCPYANSCYRKNPVHFDNYDHPPELLEKIQLEKEDQENEENEKEDEEINQEQDEEQDKPQDSKFIDALSYLEQIKKEFVEHPAIYAQFLSTMKDFKQQIIDIPTTIKNVIELFKGHNDLISGFNLFLPSNHRIDVSILNNDDSKDKDDIDLLSQKLNTTSLDNNNSTPPPPPPPQQQQQQKQKSQDIQNATIFVKKVKNTFINQPNVYREFLNILHQSKAESLPIPVIYQRIEILFNGHPDLIVEFTQFLPDTNNN